MKTIKVLLTTNVDNLGIVGDVVDVKPGYARNYLMPQGKATTPTQGNIDRLSEQRALVAAEMKRIRSVQEAMLGKLEDYEITMQRSANEQGVLFGGVSQHEIAQALRDEGFEIEDRAVRIGEQIKRLDSYQIPIALANDLKTEVKLWIVSDRPLEEEGDEDDADAGDEAEVAADTEA